LWALLLLALSTLPFRDRVRAQNVEGQIVAAQFGEFQVPAGVMVSSFRRRPVR